MASPPPPPPATAVERTRRRRLSFRLTLAMPFVVVVALLGLISASKNHHLFPVAVVAAFELQSGRAPSLGRARRGYGAKGRSTLSHGGVGGGLGGSGGELSRNGDNASVCLGGPKDFAFVRPLAKVPKKKPSSSSELAITATAEAKALKEVKVTVATKASEIGVTKITLKKVKRRRKSSLRHDWWDDNLALLRGFHAEHGHCNVPPSHPHGKALRIWIKNQRAAYQRWVKNGRRTNWEDGLNENNSAEANSAAPIDGGGGSVMNQERYEALSALGFRWTSGHSCWEDRLEELHAFRDEHGGHATIPVDSERYAELRRWALKASAEYRRGDLSPERSAALRTALPDLVTDDGGAPASRRRYPSFDDRLAELRAFRYECGHLRIPAPAASTASSSGERWSGLYHWAARQRAERRRRLSGKASTLTLEREDQLTELGFEWDPRRIQRNASSSGGAAPSSGEKCGGNVSWQARYEELLSYVAEHGHADVPQGEGALGAWVKAQRTQHRQRLLEIEAAEGGGDDGSSSSSSPPSSMTEERAALLEGAGLRWSVGRGRRPRTTSK